MKKAQSYLKIVKRHIISNKYFWKYRHVFQRKIFETSYGNLLKHHYDDTFRHISKESILDFGCATGDKLEYFINCGSKNIYGIDINSKALRTAEAKIKNFILKIKRKSPYRKVEFSNTNSALYKFINL